MKIDPAANLSPSIASRLRYLEWLFILTHLILSATSSYDRLLLHLAVYGIFIVFSLNLPSNRPLKFRRAYILLAMVSIVCANFLDVSLDLLIYLYIAKSFFLIGGKNTVYVTVVTGIGWVVSQCVSEIGELKSDGMSFEPPFGVGNYDLKTIFIFSALLYIATSIFVIFLSSTIVAEYKSRKRAEALSKQVEILAQNLERTRIARDIHDSLGHTLTNLDIQLKVAKKLRDFDLQKSFAAVDKASLLSAQCIEDVSHAVRTMRRSDFNLDRALHNLIEQFRSDRAFKIYGEIDLPQLSLSTSHQIYCIVKEGLINIQKHARASQVNVLGYAANEQIILKLSDDGVGFDPQIDSGSGIQGMKERVQAINGKLNIDSTQGKGTQITVNIRR